LAHVVLYLKPHAPFFEVPIGSRPQDHAIPDVPAVRINGYMLLQMHKVRNGTEITLPK
jgi:hypothetical protein